MYYKLQKGLYFRRNNVSLIHFLFIYNFNLVNFCVLTVLETHQNYHLSLF